jgi:hypothetical protein
LCHYLIVSLSAVFAFSSAACAGESGSFPADALRSEFPDQAALILDPAARWGWPERSREDGYLELRDASDVSRGLAARRSLSAELPSRGDQPVRFKLPDGLEVLVREDGALEGAELAEGAVAYPRRGGTSFWTAAKAGFEEWLLLDAGQAFGDRPAAAWNLEGGVAREVGDVIEVEVGGEARIRVTAPAAFAVGGRPVPVRLVAPRPDRIEVLVDAGGARVLVDPLWTSTEALIVPRSYGLTVELSSGDVLLAGGEGEELEQPKVTELYNPKANIWSPGGSIATPIQEHTLTLLASGKVLLAGGHHIDYALGKGEIVGATQLFSPATKTWATGAPMLTARSSHTATRLADGRVLVAGGTVGAGKSLTATAEIYNPQTNAWKLVAPMSTSRSGHVATLLNDGRVLVTGGQVQAGAVFTASAEIYDPALNAWKAAAPMSQPRLQHATLLLPDGRVLAAGKSYTESPGPVTTGDAEIFDPKANAWTPTAPMKTPAWGVTLTLLPSGKALLTHHEKTPHATLAQVFDPAKDVWSVATTPLSPHHWRTTTLLSTGKVLVVGGGAGVDLAPFAELFDPGSSLGLPCADGTECESGFCASGVCCDRACDGGACEACSIAAGAKADGTCAALSGKICDDGDPCTLGDACEAGACGGSPRMCKAIDACHEVGTCDSATGLCSSPRKADGQTCGGGGVCSGGFCSMHVDTIDLSPQPAMLSTSGCSCQVGARGSDAGHIGGVALLAFAARRRFHRRAAKRKRS